MCRGDFRSWGLSEEKTATKQSHPNGLVLVVDDEPEIVEDIVEHLESLGYSTKTALSGTEALMRLSGNPDIRVCLTDIRMPEMDGMGLLNQMRLRDSRRFLELRWIMLTGHATLDDEKVALTAGVSSFLRKPCSLSEITAAVGQAFIELSDARPFCDARGRNQALDVEADSAPTLIKPLEGNE